MSELIKSNEFSIVPQNLGEAWQFAEIVSQSNFCPKDFRGKPGDCLLAMQFGSELGVSPMQALQNISVINGRPSIWGDLALALVKASHRYEYINETISGEGQEMFAQCILKRKSEPEYISIFSVSDAKTAKLWGKQGPWTQYPKIMLKNRARGFALRDVFPDVLKGLITSEEAQDYQSQSEPANVSTQNPQTHQHQIHPPHTQPEPVFISNKMHRSLRAMINDIGRTGIDAVEDITARAKDWLFKKNPAFSGHLNQITEPEYIELTKVLVAWAESKEVNVNKGIGE